MQISRGLRESTLVVISHPWRCADTPFPFQTYDRFQVRFAFETDVHDFLSILYAQFPPLDPSLRTYHTQHPEPAESIAVSQSTQVYLPNDPARLINLQCASFRDIHPPPPKRRKENDENLWYGREESADARGPMQEGRRDTPRYGQGGVQAFSMGRQDSPVNIHFAFFGYLS